MKPIQINIPAAPFKSATKALTFPELIKYMQQRLMIFMREKQDGFLERSAQALVDEEFRVLYARGRLPEFSGLRITGLKLKFDVGTIGLSHWLTEFVYDVNGIKGLYPNAVALGYMEYQAHNYQMYLIGNLFYAQVTPHHYLMRVYSGLESVHPILDIAISRAFELGYKQQVIEFGMVAEENEFFVRL